MKTKNNARRHANNSNNHFRSYFDRILANGPVAARWEYVVDNLRGDALISQLALITVGCLAGENQRLEYRMLRCSISDQGDILIGGADNVAFCKSADIYFPVGPDGQILNQVDGEFFHPQTGEKVPVEKIHRKYLDSTEVAVQRGRQQHGLAQNVTYDLDEAERLLATRAVVDAAKPGATADVETGRLLISNRAEKAGEFMVPTFYVERKEGDEPALCPNWVSYALLHYANGELSMAYETADTYGEVTEVTDDGEKVVVLGEIDGGTYTYRSRYAGQKAVVKIGDKVYPNCRVFSSLAPARPADHPRYRSADDVRTAIGDETMCEHIVYALSKDKGWAVPSGRPGHVKFNVAIAEAGAALRGVVMADMEGLDGWFKVDPREVIGWKTGVRWDLYDDRFRGRVIRKVDSASRLLAQRRQLAETPTQETETIEAVAPEQTVTQVAA
jgi:bifunctional DNA-binding transcriptional regulator/antitoxin component of YhaV-PrlF toxin-antitoxin module